MFQYTSNVNIAESLFTGLYIVVSKTSAIKDDYYDEILDFLNSELRVFDVHNLVSEFISYEHYSWFKDRINFSTKLRLGPTQILWNSNEKLGYHKHILNASGAHKILKEASSCNYFRHSSINIKYITEDRYNELPNLFYKNKVIASLIIDQHTDTFSLVDLFYSKKDKYNDKVPFQFLLTKSPLVNKLIDEFDKYIVKENLHKYRKFNTEDDEFIHDCFMFLNEDLRKNSGGNPLDGSDSGLNTVYESSEDDIMTNGFDKIGYKSHDLIYSGLKEIVLNVLTSFLSQLVSYFSDENYSLDSIKKFILKPNSHLNIAKYKKSSVKTNSVYNGTSVRVYGDLSVLINRKELAINYYILSSYLFGIEGSELEYFRTLFSLSILIYNYYLSKLGVDKNIRDASIHPSNTHLSNDLGDEHYYATGNVAMDVTNFSMEFSLDNESMSKPMENTEVGVVGDINSIKIKYDKYEKYSIDGVNKDISEKALNYLLFYLNKSYKGWIKTYDNSSEVELLFVFYTNILLRIKSLFVTKVINSFIIYSNRVFSKPQQCNILKYIITLLNRSKFKRKLLFYKYLLKELTNDGRVVDEEYTEYRYKDLNEVIYNLILVSHNSMNNRNNNTLWDELDCIKYEYWYQIKNTIIDNQIVKLNNGNAPAIDNSIMHTHNYGTKNGNIDPGDVRGSGKNRRSRVLDHVNKVCDRGEVIKKVKKLILMKYLNLFDYLVEHNDAMDELMFERIKSEFVDSSNEFIITHFVLLSQSSNTHCPVSTTNNTTNRINNASINNVSIRHDASSSMNSSTGSTSVNVDINVNNDAHDHDSGSDNPLFCILNRLKKEDATIHFIGGFEEIQFNHFPIIYSIKLHHHNYNYHYSNIKKVEHVYSSSKSSKQCCIIVKTSYRYFKIKLVYNESNIIEPRWVVMNRRLCSSYKCEIRKSDSYETGIKRRRTTSTLTGSSNSDTSATGINDTCDHISGSVNNKKKYVEYVYDNVEKVVYVDKELEVEVTVDNPFPITIVLKNVRLITLGVSFVNVYNEIEVPPFKRNFKHHLKIVIKEPGYLHVIGIGFLLFDKLQCFQMLFNDITLLSELLTRYETDGNFQDSLKSDIGLMESLKKSSILELNAVNNYNKAKLNVYFTDFNNFYTDSRFNEYLSINSNRPFNDAQRLFSNLSLNTSIYDSARSNFTGLTRSISATNQGVGRGVARRSSIGSRSNTNTSINSRKSSINNQNDSGDNRNASINTRTTSNNTSIINVDSIKSEMISWFKVPRFGTGTVLKHLKLCMSYSCSYCNIFYRYYDSLVVNNGANKGSVNGKVGASSAHTSASNIDSMHASNTNEASGVFDTGAPNTHNSYTDSEDNVTVDGLINGEIKLIYIKLVNENEKHSFTHIKVTALPYYTAKSADYDVINNYKNEAYGTRRRIIKNISIAGDYVEEKLKKNKLNHMKQQFYSKFVIILNDHCQLVRCKNANRSDDVSANRGHYHDANSNSYGKFSNYVTVAPNETLYVPIIYKCNDIINNFNVILDYTIVDAPVSTSNGSPYVVKSTTDNTDYSGNGNTADGGNNTVSTRRGYVYKNVKVKVKKSLEINNIKIENIVQFNLNHLLLNLGDFHQLFKQSTLQALRTFTPIFDHKCVKLFINVINKGDTKFNCIINKTKFVSDSNCTQRWAVRLRRMNYNKNIDLYEFAQLVLAHLQVKWTCDVNKIGVTNMYNLNDYINYKGLNSNNHYTRLSGNFYDLFNRWTCRSPGRYGISMFEKLIMKNADDLIMSKLTIQLSVSQDGRDGSTNEIFNTTKRCKFTVNILVKNNGNEVINNYKVVIVPFDKECYTMVHGIEYTGCLEQLGSCPIIGISHGGTHTVINNGVNDGSGSIQEADSTIDGGNGGVNEPDRTQSITDDPNSTRNSYADEWDYYLNVANVEFMVNEPCTLGVNAGIILPEEKTIYWHHNPLTININPMDGIVFPGTLLGTIYDYTPLNNVYVKDSIIYSAILGTVSYSSDETEKKSVSVVSNHIKTPYVGATVIAQIIKLNIAKAECNIICVDGRFVKDYYRGILSSNNVLESKNIEVFMYDWFKPGDFIKSKVIYAGEGKQFILSTAGVQLGVIKTTSKNGESMVPISWKYFMSIDSKSVEKRKVARID